jgi:hypothetical protein
MKNIYKILIFLPVIFLFFTISPGCKKALDNKIVGTWRLVHVDDVSDKDIVDWVFTENNEVLFYHTPFAGTTSCLDTGQYITNTSMGKRYVEVVQCKSELNNHKYRIMKLNKKIMKLIIESKTGLTFFEFTRVEGQ